MTPTPRWFGSLPVALLAAGCADHGNESTRPHPAEPLSVLGVEVDGNLVTGGGGGYAPTVGDLFTVDLGWVTIDDLVPAGIGFMEDAATGCASPDYVSIYDADDDDGDHLNIGLPFEDGAPDGEYDVATHSATSRDSDGTTATARVSAVVDLGTERYVAMGGGVIAVELLPGNAQLQIEFRDVLFENVSTRATVTSNGSVTLPLFVGCGVLIPEEGQCGWLPEPWPFTSAYCTSLTAAFPDDVKL